MSSQTLPLHPAHGFLYHSYLVIVRHICYNWWTYLDILLTSPYFILGFTLCAVQLALWILTSAWGYASTVTVSCRIVSLPLKCLCFNPFPLNSWQSLIFLLSLQFCLFQNVTYFQLQIMWVYDSHVFPWFIGWLKDRGRVLVIIGSHIRRKYISTLFMFQPVDFAFDAMINTLVIWWQEGHHSMFCFDLMKCEYKLLRTS